MIEMTVVFRRMYGGFGIYGSLVEDYRKTYSPPEDNLTEKWWKERVERGLNCSLDNLIYLMWKRKFRLRFLTDSFAIFTRASLWERIKGRF